MAIKLNQETKTTSMLQFTLNKNHKNNGLSCGKLVEVKVETSENKEDSKWIFFRGKTTPRLVFVFEEVHQLPERKDLDKGTYIKSFIPVSPTGNIKVDYVKEVSDQVTMLAHFIDAIKGNRDGVNITFDESKNSTPEEVIEQFTALYEEVAKLLNKEEYKVQYWLKLLLYINGTSVNNDNPGIGKYVGDGVIEKVSFDANKVAKQPIIRVKIEKGEDIVPKAKEAKKPSNANSVPGGSIVPGGEIKEDFFGK